MSSERDAAKPDTHSDPPETLHIPRAAAPTDETEMGPNASGPQTKSGQNSTEASFLGNYAGLVEIGRGGMSIVYRALQRDLGRTVAVKKLLAGGEADAELLTRFQNEAEAVAKLSHPNIVQIFQTGQTPQGPYFILEFVAGGTLRQKMADGPTKPQDAARLIETIARAMAVAHDEGIIHRDLKPGNILLTKEGVPKVADFGLAKRLETPSVTRTGEIMGTPSYMAPEQAQGSSRQVTAAADIYALGAILYEMLTGRPPHRGADAMETVYQVLHDDPITPRKLTAAIPVDLETISMKCLEKAPAKRYKSMEALADDLRRYLRGEPILAKPTPAWQRVQKWIHRYPGWAAVVLIFVLSAATIVTVSLVYNQYLIVERDLAEENFSKAKSLIDTWYNLTLIEVQRSPQELTPTQSLMANKSIAFYKSFAEKNRHRPELEMDLFETMRVTGDLCRLVGDYPQAKRIYDDLRLRIDAKLGKDPSQLNVVLEKALTANQQAVLARSMNQEQDAARYFRDSLDAYDEAFKLGDADVETQARRARTTYNYALLLISQQDPKAEGLLSDAATLHRKLIELRPKEAVHHFDLAYALVGLARVHWNRGDITDATRLFEESLEEWKTFQPHAEKEDPRPREFAATNYANLGTLARLAGKLDKALDFTKIAQEHITQLRTDYPAIPKFKELSVDILVQEANLHGLSGDSKTGLTCLTRAEEEMAELAKSRPQKSEYRIRRLELSVMLAYFLEEAAASDEPSKLLHASELDKAILLAKELFESGELTIAEVAKESKWTIFRLQPKLAALLPVSPSETPP
jgi:serine/threonine protein kinase